MLQLVSGSCESSTEPNLVTRYHPSEHIKTCSLVYGADDIAFDGPAWNRRLERVARLRLFAWHRPDAWELSKGER